MDYGDGLNDPINNEYRNTKDKISEEYDVDTYENFIGEYFILDQENTRRLFVLIRRVTDYNGKPTEK